MTIAELSVPTTVTVIDGTGGDLVVPPAEGTDGCRSEAVVLQVITVASPGFVEDSDLSGVDLTDRPLVVVVDRDRLRMPELQSTLRRAGADPLRLAPVVITPRERDLADFGARLAVRVRAAAARAAVCTPVPADQVKLRTPRVLDRRALLGRPRFEYAAGPGIDHGRCAADRGCRACVTACPTGALSVSGTAVSHDLAACMTCGICVTECPTAAVRHPVGGPEQLAAEVREVLAAGVGPVGVALTCSRGDQLDLPEGWFPVVVPCTGMVPGGWMPAILEAGAGSVAVVPCDDTGCPNGLGDRSRAAVADGRAIVGVDDAVRLLDRLPSAPPVPGPGGADLPVLDLGATSDAAVAVEVAQRRQIEVLECGPTVRVGAVDIDADVCTTCGACASICPTGALSATASEQGSAIAFDHASCVGCGQCLPRCPEADRGAIGLRREVRVDQFLEPPRTVAQTRTAMCELCGGPVAPAAMLARLAEMLDEETASFISRRCSACR